MGAILRHGLLVFGLISASVVSTGRGAVVIYREQFGRTVGVGGNQSINQFDWALHGGATATNNNGTNTSSNTAGKPQNVGNVNAGESTAALTNGYAFRDTASTLLFWTPEFSFDPADYEAGSVQFKWYQGNANGNAGNSFGTPQSFQLAVQIGGQWYLNNTSFGNTSVIAGGNFQLGDDNGNGDISGNHGAELKTLTFDPTAANWSAFTFDGTFSTSTHTAAAGTTMTAGSVLGSNLPAGAITAFGLYSPEALAGNRRFDTFTIEATPVPEPAALAGALLGVGLLGRTRRRRGR
jgi:hypothetical protein